MSVDLAFATALTESPRGPLRDGAFALWLVVRAALDAPATPPDKHIERLKAVTARLRSLNAPGPLKRALAAALTDIAPKGAGPAVALNQLVAPTTETLGRRLAETVSQAARTVKA